MDMSSQSSDFNQQQVAKVMLEAAKSVGLTGTPAHLRQTSMRLRAVKLTDKKSQAEPEKTYRVHKVPASRPFSEHVSDFTLVEYGTGPHPVYVPEPEEPEQASDVLHAIKYRRSVGQVTQEIPERAQIERLLEAATYAPSHHVTEPWRFFVLMGAAREQLGTVMMESLAQKLEKPLSPKAQFQLRQERNKPLRAPVLIITVVPGSSEVKGDLVENLEAAAAAVQNMLLEAEELGLASIWRTGEAVHNPMIKRWLGVSLESQIVGFIYIGYARVIRPLRVPTHYSEKTVWLS